MYTNNMKQKRPPKLDIKNYVENASNNFSLNRLIAYTLISIILTVLLAITTIKQDYSGTPLIYISIAFVLILGYTILNILALIRKIKDN